MRIVSRNLFVLMAAVLMLDGLGLSNQAEAGFVAVNVAVGGHAGMGGMGMGPGGCGSGFGCAAMSPGAYGYGFGRYPLRGFRTPLRPWGGVAPVRQFLFGRGRTRRMVRRAAVFGVGRGVACRPACFRGGCRPRC